MEHMTGIEIKCNKEQKETLLELLADGLSLGNLSHKEFVKDILKDLLENQIKWNIVELGHITDEEIDAFGKFSDKEKQVIKKQYSTYPKGFFANPRCALY